MARRKFTLYWTNLERYEQCPQKFLWYRGWGDIDLGNGPGRSKPKPFRSSRHHAVMGIVIANVMERLYNDEWWRDPATLKKRLVDETRREWKYQTAKEKNWIDYRTCGSTKAELLQVCIDGILGFLRTMKHHRLLGEYARSEVELLGFIDKWNPVGGRADLIVRRKDTGIRILDGKNAKSKGKYTNPDQLRWYAMLFYLQHRVMPNELGFIYYRYPYGLPILDEDDNETGEKESGIDWVPFTKADLKGLAHRAVEARRGMNAEAFDANPVPSVCRWCDYETVCPARQAQLEVNRAKRGKKKKVEELEGTRGFVNLKL
jgi:CRISPR/Cas system-associated exonuclease Cas4 (RecB family)